MGKILLCLRGESYMIVLYPKCYFHVIHNNINEYMHGFYNELKRNNVNNIYFFVNTLHVCSTDLGWNPIYTQVGRFENNAYNINLPHGTFINYYFNGTKFVHDPSKTTQYYEKWLNEDTLQQYL
jgi:hypothetical protein